MKTTILAALLAVAAGLAGVARAADAPATSASAADQRAAAKARWDAKTPEEKALVGHQAAAQPFFGISTDDCMRVPSPAARTIVRLDREVIRILVSRSLWPPS